jgi:3-dehydroquinate dehydratase-2
VYGRLSLAEVNRIVRAHGRKRGARVECRQSNVEGELIGWLQGAEREGFAGVVFNPGAFTHYSIALRDAVAGIQVPVVEVHLSNIQAARSSAATRSSPPSPRGQIAGFGPHSYLLASRHCSRSPRPSRARA